MPRLLDEPRALRDRPGQQQCRGLAELNAKLKPLEQGFGMGKTVKTARLFVGRLRPPSGADRFDFDDSMARTDAMQFVT